MKPYFYPVHLLLRNKRKKDHNPGPYLGRPLNVPREGKKSVRVRLYRPVGDEGDALPVLFNIHGGAWIHGDGEGVDLQSQYLANHIDCLVVNIDYRLADEYPFPYQQNECADTVEFFLSHADAFRLDPARAAVMGYSAGGHIAAGTAIVLRDRGVKIAAQVLCYPFLNFVGFDFAAYGGMKGAYARLFNWFSDSVLFEKLPKTCALVSPGYADPADLRGLAPAVIISCGAGDPLLPQAAAYAEKLTAAGVPAVYREYETAEHGFMERNFRDDPAVFAAEDAQDRLMREAVDFVQAPHIFG